MNKQEQIIKRLKAYAKENGKKCDFEEIPDVDGMMKHMEEIHDEETGLDYATRICVEKDGDLMIYSYISLNLEEDDIDKTKKYLERLTDESESFEYELEGETLFVTAYMGEEGIESFGEEFESVAFTVTKEEFIDCMVGLISYLEGDVEFEDAIHIGLENEDIDEKFDPEMFMYSFEHYGVVEQFLEDPATFIERCLCEPGEESETEENEEDAELPEGFLDNFVFATFQLMAMKENIEHNFTVDDFEIKHSKVAEKYDLLTIGMPTPSRERLCYKMDVLYEEGKEADARIFTIELGEEDTKFLCSWVMREGRRTHLNYNITPKDKTKYINQIVGIYEGKVMESIACTPGDVDEEE